MIDHRTAPYAALLLRVTLGLLFLIHFSVKLFVFTPAGTAQFFGSLGLPPALAYLVMVGEFVGGLALILGIWTRVAAVVLMPIMLGAIFTVHGQNGFLFTAPNGGWEYPAFWTIALLTQALLGDGALNVKLPFLARTPSVGAFAK
ncbi:MAG TPA: DoxX family protein [Stellaceae bacterium]|nr:DoxX family protein [Stellaceae bacterium]